ncbi:hypothetical protein [Leisingera sp. M523]|uniref:hypothetical protein n=1 Tax=Leisingera sp. M523 TaxID=2867013 RepID=UPI0021A3A9A7|nr:hypothetical protein [Leisingera sp. M523]UWQ29241.1 hypothetical protein K3557_01255 [Leisingera sp. M523]
MTKTKVFFQALAGTASILGVVFIALSLLLDEIWRAENALLIFTNGFYLFVFPPIIILLLADKPSESFKSPTIKKVMSEDILLVESSEWLGHQTAVAIYKIDEDYEQLVALGEVINVQSNGLVQIAFSKYPHEEANSLDFNEIRAKLMIKPGVRA